MQTQVSQTLQLLLARFDGKILVPLAEGAECISMPIQTARNKLCRGDFPLPTIQQGRRRYIHIHDIAGYIDLLHSGSEVPLRRGAKTKKERIAARDVKQVA